MKSFNPDPTRMEEQSGGRHEAGRRVKLPELGMVDASHSETGPVQLEMPIGDPSMEAEPRFGEPRSTQTEPSLRSSTREAPRAERPAGAPNPRPASLSTEPRPRRFVVLATTLALAASIGALGGSLALGAIGRFLPPVPAAKPVAHSDTADEIRLLKEAVSQLRGNMKVLSDHMAAVRSGLSASSSNSAAQLAKLVEAVEKLERMQGERRGAPASAPETTGSTAAPPDTPKPAVVEGWVLRKAARDAALVEGRYGVIEIEPGDHLPGVGRVEQIKRQDGRWVVVTAKGLILPAR